MEGCRPIDCSLGGRRLRLRFIGRGRHYRCSESMNVSHFRSPVRTTCAAQCLRSWTLRASCGRHATCVQHAQPLHTASWCYIIAKQDTQPKPQSWKQRFFQAVARKVSLTVLSLTRTPQDTRRASNLFHFLRSGQSWKPAYICPLLIPYRFESGIRISTSSGTLHMFYYTMFGFLKAERTPSSLRCPPDSSHR